MIFSNMNNPKNETNARSAHLLLVVYLSFRRDSAESFSMQQQDSLPFPSFEDHLEQGLGGFLSSMEKMFSTVFENEFPQPGERKHSSNEMPMPRPFGSFPRFEHFHDNRKQKQEKNNKSVLGDDFQEA